VSGHQEKRNYTPWNPDTSLRKVKEKPSFDWDTKMNRFNGNLKIGGFLKYICLYVYKLIIEWKPKVKKNLY